MEEVSEDVSTTVPEEPQPVESAPAPGAAKPEEVENPAEPNKDGSDSDDEDDDEDVIEESPCSRYQKRREVVKYRDVPGIDTAYLAMDTDEGVEVVWNEAIFSGTKKFKSKEEAKLKNVFEALTLIDHPNIVKFHRYWTDDGGTFNEKSGQTNPPRLVFITEFMSSGTLKQFLRKTKRNKRKIQVQSWKRWCTQILSALNYLHATCDPPILHGNLTCDTIFIQHNGLVKIGSVAPDIIHQNVKTCRDNIARNKHFLAPEWGITNESTLNTAIDIYAFGMCALETAALELLPAHPNSSGNGSGASGNGNASTSTEMNGNADNEVSCVVTEESVQRTIDSLEDEMQKDFIRKCLRKTPEERPTARELLFHPVLFEVHSLKLLAAHILVNTPGRQDETMTDEAIQTHYGRDTVMATVKRMSDGKIIEYKLSDFPVAEKLEKFMEDVKYGIYPLTAFALSQPPPPKTRAVTPSEGPNESAQSVTPEPQEPEDRWGIEFKCYIGPPVPAAPTQVTLLTKMCDGMNRQMQALLSLTDTPETIAAELLEHQIINWRDVPSIAKLMTLGFIQRANETAEYLAKNEANSDQEHEPNISNDKRAKANKSKAPMLKAALLKAARMKASMSSKSSAAGKTSSAKAKRETSGSTEEKTPTATVQVQQQQSEASGENVSSSNANSSGENTHDNSAENDDSEVFEDPTQPQPLEGRFAGLEAMFGNPQMTLAESISAGMTHGGLHIPKEKFQFTGSVAEIDQKLQVELFEWHRLKATEKATAEQQVETAQNGAQVEDQPQDQPENEERSPSQQRES